MTTLRDRIWKGCSELPDAEPAGNLPDSTPSPTPTTEAKAKNTSRGLKNHQMYLIEVGMEKEIGFYNLKGHLFIGHDFQIPVRLVASYKKINLYDVLNRDDRQALKHED